MKENIKLIGKAVIHLLCREMERTRKELSGDISESERILLRADLGYAEELLLDLDRRRTNDWKN